MPAVLLEPQQLARCLLRLARAGAYATPASDDTEPAYAVHSPRNAFAAPVARIPVDAMAKAQALGWVTARPDGSMLLSRRGLRAVKREIATPASQPPARSGRAKAIERASVPAAAGIPQRIEGPLQWLRKRKDRSGKPLITQIQFEAGERFAADYGRGQMQPRITASWSQTAPCMRVQAAGGGVEISDAARAARDRFYRAMTAVGAEMGDLLVDVCCHDIGLEAAERARGWPVRSGKVVLDMGLTALARHYGLEPMPVRPDDRPPAPRRPRRWVDAAYTPTLDRWT